MWASLQTWLFGDGQIREIALGQVIEGCGLRLRYSRLTASTDAVEGLDEAPLDTAGRIRYRIVGRCLEVASPLAILLGMPDWRCIAEPETYRAVPGAVDSPAYEPWSAEFVAPERGGTAEAEGWLEVVADHEWDAFAIPDSRMRWRIQAIRLLEHQLLPAVDEPRGTLTFGPVISVTEQDRLSRATDRSTNTRYLVDLIPQ